MIDEYKIHFELSKLKMRKIKFLFSLIVVGATNELRAMNPDCPDLERMFYSCDHWKYEVFFKLRKSAKPIAKIIMSIALLLVAVILVVYLSAHVTCYTAWTNVHVIRTATVDVLVHTRLIIVLIHVKRIMKITTTNVEIKNEFN